jgi:hypothetical protein
VGLNATNIEKFLNELSGDDLHVKTIQSIALGTLGALHAVSLCLHVVGRAMAWARGKDPKHCVKQFDRLLSNSKFDLGRLWKSWAAFVLAEREDALVAVDWTEFDGDDTATLCAYLVSRHGRATPLLWKSVVKSELSGQRNAHEDALLETLREVIPASTRVTVLADRGFGDKKRYEQLRQLNFDYIIRFRQDILVTNEFGKQQKAGAWLHTNGRARKLHDMGVTADCYVVPAVVVVHAKGMKDAWCLASSRADLSAADVVKLYGRRFTIEETFRDTKDIRFGMGLSATHIHDTGRRDRLLFIAALSHVLMTLLGAAGERCGLDRTLKSNTSKRRTMSLYNQGTYWYMAIPNLRNERLVMLAKAYDEVLHEHAFMREFLGIL